MHTVGNKISARERELAPRYYYKIEQSRTCIEKIKAFFRALLTFMFTQVGVVVLVVTYMIIGAVIFEHLEGESQMEVAVEALEVRKTFYFSISSRLTIWNALSCCIHLKLGSLNQLDTEVLLLY